VRRCTYISSSPSANSVPLIKRHLYYFIDFDSNDPPRGSVCPKHNCTVCSVIMLVHDLSALSLSLNLGSISCMSNPSFHLLTPCPPELEPLPLHSLTVAMMSRITLHLKRFARRPNNVVYHDPTPPPFSHRRFLSSSPLLSRAPPTSVARPTPHVTYISAARAPPGNEPYFPMDTFSTGTVAREFDVRHSPDLVEPEASVG
jgi:hypothetical protein